MTAVGIDISKTGLDICLALTTDPQDARTWTVHHLDYTDPDWWQDFADLLPAVDRYTICCEPTGVNYMLPVPAALRLCGADFTLHLVNNHVSGQIRSIYISSAKTDALDAQTLALAALMIEQGGRLRGVRKFEGDREMLTADLRQLVNDHARLTKQRTRLLNQLDAIAHGIWPGLAISKTTWMTCVRLDAITPAEIITLANGDYIDVRQRDFMTDGRRARPIRKLADNLPAVHNATPAQISAAAAHTARLDQLSRELTDLETIIEAEIHSPLIAAITIKWQTVPTISAQDIAAFHVATHCAADQYTRDEFVSAVGASPLTKQSAFTDATGRTRRKGYRPSLQSIFLLTNRLLSPNTGANPIKTYKDRLAGHERPGAPCRRKLAAILSGIARSPEGAWPQ